MDGNRVRFIPCATWIPKGVAKNKPDRVELSKEDLAQMIKETEGNLRELEEDEETANEELEEENKDATQQTKQMNTKHATKMTGNKDDDEIDFRTRYNLDKYDEEMDDDKLDKFLKMGSLFLHSSSEDDPYITVKDDEDDNSDDENEEIKPSDNLIAVGVVEGDAALLEVYVYNSEEGSLYVHHDILLPAVPICMEWLNYDREDEQLKPGNLVAIGSMSPVIDVWDLDIIDTVQPSYSLGKRGKKKKRIAGSGHKDAVLTISWNKNVEHVLASGSVDQTVNLWDLECASAVQQLTSFEEMVQTISWHHKDAHTLLTGACDRKVRIFDCRTSDDYKTWELDGEVECTIWQTTTSDPNTCLASTEEGTVYAIDVRQEKPLWSIKAHDKACTAIQMSPVCPGCLVTVSDDKSIKTWDIDGKPSFISENLPNLGMIQCLASCPDAPFVFCAGGDNKENNFKVWDIRQSKEVRTRFCRRVGLPVDDDDDDDIEEDDKDHIQMDIDGEKATTSTSVGHKAVTTGAKPKSKFKKKKGGHVDKKNKKHRK
ncbi:hypothetical protein Pmani_005466 [Petrolisthes manimaculis]|uniref:Periodic tryptophan protein 1 n=1 Tax=Petrolisthes manimaculis TaxID=1843537 RepID=A0AAE1UKH6_9EUCA|nr:hypothetical protein Pmani_005466 [Petrolisthes manimaculis]